MHVGTFPSLFSKPNLAAASSITCTHKTKSAYQPAVLAALPAVAGAAWLCELHQHRQLLHRLLLEVLPLLHF